MIILLIDSRSENLLLAYVGHPISRHVVVIIDWRSVRSHIAHCGLQDLLYPPHILLFPVNALLPCSTRQLSNTESVSIENICIHAGLTERSSRLQFKFISDVRVFRFENVGPNPV